MGSVQNPCWLMCCSEMFFVDDQNQFNIHFSTTLKEQTDEHNDGPQDS